MAQLNAIDVRVGARIRRRRQDLKMSQAKLAKAIGVTFQQVQKYERGANRVSASRLQLIAHALRISVDYFFDPASSEGKQNDPLAAIARFLADPRCRELNEAFLRINRPDLRKVIIKLIDKCAVPNGQANGQSSKPYSGPS